ncbi:MAG: ATP-dependent helicase [Desulfovibrio sp.]|uniref:ATP-dependent helicase n=1 Tax=Desulfovibrio sp. TaxID=885 RepID=UPI0039E46F07
MLNSTQYLKEASGLRNNLGQWEAYESRGSCVITAGPGSGKTKVLTLKMARMLAEDVNEPRGLVCITYSNECARELEKRLAMLGIEPGKRIFIGTVHSFSLTQIILPYAKTAQMGLPEDFRVATKKECAEALERAFTRTIRGRENPQVWMYRMGKYRRSMLDRTSHEWTNSDPELAGLVTAFEEELRAMGRIDFDDIPLLALTALKNNTWLQKALFAKFPILIIDEYQDLGVALHHMVKTLCIDAGTRLFAVGDVDQSIYGFQGANPELFHQLLALDGVQHFKLRLNYRCGSRIVAASTVALDVQRDYQAVEGNDAGLIFFHPQKGRYEAHAAFFFSKLLPAIQARLPELKVGDIAVLYPEAWMGDIISSESEKYGIPIIRSDKNSIYPRNSRLLRWLEMCAEWCCGGWEKSIPKFSQIMNECQRLFAKSLRDDFSRIVFQQNIIRVLWGLRNTELQLSQWLETIDSKVISECSQDGNAMHAEFEMLAGFKERCTTGDCSNMRLTQFADQGRSQDCLMLSTLHSSKGREFSVVILFGMDEGRMPRRGGNEHDIIEARRSFYVGFTRAKKELHLMYSACSPSRFVTHVKEALDEV